MLEVSSRTNFAFRVSAFIFINLSIVFIGTPLTRRAKDLISFSGGMRQLTPLGK